MSELTHKSCSKCKEKKSTDQFSRRQFTPSGNWGYVSWCHACRSVKFKKNWSEGTYRDSVYRRKFGITIADYDRILVEQEGCCDICGTDTPQGHGAKNKRFSVDHNHSTGKARGLLCHHCNIALGSFKDNIESMAKAIDYIRKHS